MVEVVQIDVRQQRTDDAPLWGAVVRFCDPSFLHDPGLQKLLNQAQDPTIGDAALHSTQERAMRNGVEASLQIRVHHPDIPGVQMAQHHTQSILGLVPRSEAVAAGVEVHLEDGFQHQPQRRLHDAITDRRDAQRSFLVAARFRNPHPADRLGLVSLQSPALHNPGNFLVQPFTKRLHRHSIDSGGASIARHQFVAPAQRPRGEHLVVDPIPTSSIWPSAAEGFQHPLRPHRAVGEPQSIRFRGKHSPCGHFCR